MRCHPYIALRDLHSVCGVYAWAIALVIVATGLVYTYVWGGGFNYAAVRSGTYEIFANPPESISPAELPRVALDEIVAVADRELPDCTLFVRLPRGPRGASLCSAHGPVGRRARA